MAGPGPDQSVPRPVAPASGPPAPDVARVFGPEDDPERGGGADCANHDLAGARAAAAATPGDSRHVRARRAVDSIGGAHIRSERRNRAMALVERATRTRASHWPVREYRTVRNEDIGERLRTADPVVRERGLSMTEIQEMRRTIVAAG